jgi:hypothetical protein
MQTPWTVTQLQKLLNNDLQFCHTSHERMMVKALGGKEIREAATAFAQTRKLTPGEIAIASQYGYRF